MKISKLRSLTFATALLVGISSIAARAEEAANILPEGTFDARDGQFFAGWKAGGYLGGTPAWNNTITMEAEKEGAPFARLSVKDQKGASVGISQTEKLVLNPAWKSITLKVSVRMADFTKASDWGGRGQFSIKFTDGNGKPLPSELYLGVKSNTAGWEEIGKGFPIPSGAASMVVEVQLIGATGIMDVRNLRAIPAQP